MPTVSEALSVGPNVGAPEKSPDEQFDGHMDGNDYGRRTH